MEKDPVCGMLVAPELAAGQRQHQDRTYYFCSPVCLSRFDQAPERYLPADPPGSAPER